MSNKNGIVRFALLLRSSLTSPLYLAEVKALYEDFDFPPVVRVYI